MNIILMGLPGAGKGTQASKIIEKYGFPHISTGDLFRAAIKDGTELGKEAKQYMDKGELVPDSVTNGLVKERLQQPDTEKGFMLDGFPRTLNQAEALEEILTDINKQIDAVIHIDVATDILKKRLTGRFICNNCGATYNKYFNPPKNEGTCDVCGSHDFYQREDDKPEVIEKRIDVNMEKTQALLDYYSAQDKVYSVPGDIGIDNVFAKVQDIIEK